MAWIVSFLLFLFTLYGVVIASTMLSGFKTAQSRQLGVVIISSSAASLAYGLEILSPGLYEKYAWVVVRYFSLNVFVLATALFVFYISDIPIRFRSWSFLALCLIPAIAMFFMVTFPMTHLVYDRIWLTTEGGIPMIGRTVGSFYWVLNLYNIVILIVLIYLALRNISHGSLLNRQQSTITAGALGLIGGTHILYLGGIRLLEVLNPNLFSYFPAAVLIFWGAQRFRLADIRPVARNLLFEQMLDGILVVNPAGELIDINPAAEKILNISQRSSVGKSLMTSSVELAEMISRIESHEKIKADININEIPMNATIHPFVIHKGEERGYLIILRDITDRVEAEKLKETEIKRQSSWMERQKIARTLHDSISQYLNSQVLLAGSAQKRLEIAKYDQLAPIIGHISTAARKASEEMRALISELQIESPADPGFDLIGAVRERLRFIGGQSVLQTAFDSPGSLELDSAQQREIFYILLEALNNVLRHSAADRVEIRFLQDQGQFVAEISDDGIGFDPNRIIAGMGLANMKERARQLNGQFSIESAVGTGTRLCLKLPLK